VEKTEVYIPMSLCNTQKYAQRV